MSSPAVPRHELEEWFCHPRCKEVGGSTPVPRVGAEYEFLVVDRTTKRELPFEGPRGVETLLAKLRDAGTGWKDVREDGRLIGLNRADGSTLTLEPGSQLELSTPPHDSVLEVDAVLRAFVVDFARVTAGSDFALLAAGMNPFSAARDIVLGPKRRYAVMTAYLEKKGALALDMMRRTLSVHCSFDFTDEADAAEKTRTGFAAAPIVTALFAHSPIDCLRASGFASYRAEIWRHTDPDRCGILPEVFRPGWGFSRYVDRVLELPLIFTYVDGEYRPAHGLPARRWFDEGFEGARPQPGDLEWVINQSFRDARLRRYLECRAADFPPARMATAPVAMWTGLLYDANARAGVWELMKGLDDAGRETLAASVAKDGLRAKVGKRSAAEVGREMLALARRGLVARRRGEETLLDPVDALAGEGQSPSDVLLDRWNGPLAKDPAKLIDELAF